MTQWSVLAIKVVKESQTTEEILNLKCCNLSLKSP